MQNLSNLTVVWCLLFFPPFSIADSGAISPGDHLFIKAQVIKCGQERYFVEEGKVTEDGTVKFFQDFEFETHGKTLEELTSEFIVSWRIRSGQNSRTIEIVNLPADPEALVSALMQIYMVRKSCLGPPDNYHLDSPGFDWSDRFQIAGGNF
jgi:hypothetical protein